MPSTKFNVVLENIELSKEQKSALQKDINAIVAKHVATIDHSAAIGKKDMVKINPEWLGIWLRRFKDYRAIELSKTYDIINR
ncbi:hypothetical protein [Emticicia soli]|uniref:Uncharacterized protein n=1 Tax=Emticicia soli TaxID=2027878 RepID=A0ABW5J4A4_9BACT